MQRRAFICVLFLGLHLSSTSAQDAPPRLATKEQYAACLESSEEIDRRTQTLTKRQQEHKALSAKFQAADGRLSAQVQRHVPRTKAEVESYNQAVAKRNAAVKDFNERSRTIERDQVALNTLVLQTNATCGALLISHEVKEAVDAERRTRAAKQ
jgi:hypothetical protein